MRPATIRADVWRRYLATSGPDRPATIADLLTADEFLCLSIAGVRATNAWFAGQAEVDAVENRIARLERITNVLRRAVQGEL